MTVVQISKRPMQDRDAEIFEDREIRRMTFIGIAKKHRISRERASAVYKVEKYNREFAKPIPNDVGAARIWDLPLSVRLRIAIRNSCGIDFTVNEMKKLTYHQLLWLPNMGRRTVEEWYQFAQQNGIEVMK